jgi:hypothetical protein
MARGQTEVQKGATVAGRVAREKEQEKDQDYEED